ncbi:hypothetical protein C8J56DRAFT_1007726 [Mycena floridula]|nr:hypothetical protein C8J56DRAFT_1007726 [Mycena floridula]
MSNRPEKRCFLGCCHHGRETLLLFSPLNVAQTRRETGIGFLFNGSGCGATSLLKTLATEDYNIIVSSPKNFFLFTPLLMSVAVGTLNRSCNQHDTRSGVAVIEAKATKVDVENRTVTFADKSGIQVEPAAYTSTTTIPYDYLVYAVGAEVQTFGIKGEIADAEKMQRRFMGYLESAGFMGNGEIHDFLENNLELWYPELASRIRITLVAQQARELDDVTFTNRRGIRVDDYLRMVGTANEVSSKDEKNTKEIGISFPPSTIFAIRDCTATSYAPTAQVASQQGAYLGRLLKGIARREALEARSEATDSTLTSKGEENNWRRWVKFRPFHYSHQGSLAYIGSDKAIADLPFMNGNIASGGVLTYLFWRSAYLSTLFSLRNRTLVMNDWLITKVFGRYVFRELFMERSCSC